jgi:hypothetical protein
MKKKPTKKAGLLPSYLKNDDAPKRRGRKPGPKKKSIAAGKDDDIAVVGDHGEALFSIEKNVPIPYEAKGKGNTYAKEKIVKLLNTIKVGDSFVMPKSMKASFNKYHFIGQHGYSFKWLLIEPEKKNFRGWRVH